MRAVGTFNLHLLEFTFVYQFYSRKTTLVESTFWNPAGLFAFMSFHNHFKLVGYLKWEVSFAPISFEIQWDGIWTDNIQSFEISFHLSFELQIYLEVNLPVWNANELENERGKVLIKQAQVRFTVWYAIKLT